MDYLQSLRYAAKICTLSFFEHKGEFAPPAVLTLKDYATLEQICQLFTKVKAQSCTLVSIGTSIPNLGKCLKQLVLVFRFNADASVSHRKLYLLAAIYHTAFEIESNFPFFSIFDSIIHQMVV